ncbi:hypothetical protein MSSAC_1912 [Methanosarcina siciliae C2J]|uniref:Uncharacterized protein n=1 Tax=Methanosarcina siciliae C2J TaxID=1434118 RepID=A0A0E3PM35_9EURY|nr:hypothetical protein MSSAC_1912 [Methanosarcina siciliae C2J]
MTRNYRLIYDTNYSDMDYYIMADKDNWSDIRSEFVTEMKEDNKKIGSYPYLLNL